MHIPVIVFLHVHSGFWKTHLVGCLIGNNFAFVCSGISFIVFVLRFFGLILITVARFRSEFLCLCHLIGDCFLTLGF